jgi:hypothetical protein
VTDQPFVQVFEGRWPSGDAKPIAVLRQEPDELAKRLPIRFTAGRDDLDEYVEAALRLPSGRGILLIRHRHSPYPGTEVQADSEDAADEARKELLSALVLNDDAFAWTRREP